MRLRHKLTFTIPFDYVLYQRFSRLSVPPLTHLHDMQLRVDDRIADLARRLRCRECESEERWW